MVPVKLFGRGPKSRLARTAAVYAAAVIALLEGVDVLVSTLHVAGWALPLALAAALMGLPVALLVGWALDEPGAVGRLRARSRPAAATVALAVALAVGGVALASWRAAAHGADSGIRSVAVLPLANQMGDPSQEYFVEGMHDALITELARIEGLSVISRTSVMRYAGTRLPTAEIAAELGVEALVQGSVFRAADSVRITVQLIRGRPEEHLWAQAYEGELSEALALQRRVASSIAGELYPRFFRAPRRPPPALPVDPHAHEEYLRGRARWRSRSRDGLAAAVVHLESAVRIQPDFALAWAGLADAYMVARGYGAIDLPWEEAYRRAREAAERALTLDPELADAHASLAFIRFQSDWDLDAGERGLRRAVQLNPSSSQAHAWLSTVLKSRGRAAEAVAAARRARELDPFSALMNRYLGFALAKSGNCGEALEMAHTAVALDPAHPDGYWILWTCHVQAGRHGDAVAAAAQAYAAWGVPEDDIERFRHAFAQEGWNAALGAELRILRSGHAPVRTEYMLAQRFALLGRRDATLQALEAALLVKDPVLLFEARMDPLLSSVRHDPRLRELLAGAGLLD